MRHLSAYSRGAKAGIVGALSGALASAVLLFVPLGQYGTETADGVTTTGRTPAAIAYLFGVEGADPALFFWSLAILAVSLLGGYGAVSERPMVVWAVAVAFTALTVLGALSIGLFVAPAALLFVLAGVWVGLPRLRRWRSTPV